VGVLEGYAGGCGEGVSGGEVRRGDERAMGG
jgi:hypothetical protein